MDAVRQEASADMAARIEKIKQAATVQVYGSSIHPTRPLELALSAPKSKDKSQIEKDAAEEAAERVRKIKQTAHEEVWGKSN